MKNYTSHFRFFLPARTERYVRAGFVFCCFVFFSLFSISVAFAGSYPKIAPGDTVTLGEFVFDDDFVATTTAGCVLSIFDPDENLVFNGAMTASSTGWTYHNYAVPLAGPSGIWPTQMTCGSVPNGDLVKVDKSFIVEEIAKHFTVTLSDFEGTTVNTAYKAKLQVLNYLTVPTDADSLPTVVIKDSAGTEKVPNELDDGEMDRDSAGTYSYSYTVSGVGGAWETMVSVVIDGQTIKKYDYWNLSSSPADVQIIDITDKIIPAITASVRIDNKGTVESDFYYVYCIVNSESNLCGGNDDVDSASGTVFINAGSFVNLSLTLDDVPTAGTYWFKVRARALAETNWAAATQQFTAESGATPTPPPPPSGGGGGGGTAIVSETTTTTHQTADFNQDGKVNSVDFSILLFFWKTRPPFANPRVDINKDGKVDSVDFSILLYQWKK